MSRFFWYANVLFRLTCNSPAAHRLDGYATKDFERKLDQEPQDLQWQHQDKLHLLSSLSTRFQGT